MPNICVLPNVLSIGWLLASNPGLIRVWLRRKFKNFRRASRESLSLSFIFNTFPNVTLYVLAGYSDQKFSPRFARKFKFKFHLQHFSECHALCFSRVCNTRPVNLCKHLVKSIGWGSGIPKSKSCFFFYGTHTSLRKVHRIKHVGSWI